MIKTTLIVLSLCIFGSSLLANDLDSTDLKILKQHEKKLLHYFDSLKKVKTEKTSLLINQKILDEFDQALGYHASFHYSFDTIKQIGNIQSNDKQLKIFTWNIPLNHGMHKYYGYIQRYDKKADTTYLYKLMDQEEQGKPHDFKEFTPRNWYGALYYEVIDQKINGKKIYTLLGYDLNDMLSNYKMIDVLSFQNNQPVLGAPLFNYEKKNPYRVIFEYSSRASMALTYDQQMGMIIFDHLAPFQPSMKGNPQFYGPDSSYDGFKFDNNRWNHHADVDARNR